MTTPLWKMQALVVATGLAVATGCTGDESGGPGDGSESEHHLNGASIVLEAASFITKRKWLRPG